MAHVISAARTSTDDVYSPVQCFSVPTTRGPAIPACKGHRSLGHRTFERTQLLDNADISIFKMSAFFGNVVGSCQHTAVLGTSNSAHSSVKMTALGPMFSVRLGKAVTPTHRQTRRPRR